MSQDFLLISFEFAVLIFAFTVHEAAHAWTAWRLGDPTARMLGRVTLNPVKHIDPLGSVIIPLIAAVYHWPLIGWAKPTPITSRNFKNYKRDDILVTLAGPASNLLMASVSLILLVAMKHAGGVDAINGAIYLSQGGKDLVLAKAPRLFPVALLLYCGVLINLSLFVFNLLPIPPLDGSHVVSHFLPYRAQQMYDKVGQFGILILMIVGGRVMGVFLYPLLDVFNRVLEAL